MILAHYGKSFCSDNIMRIRKNTTGIRKKKKTWFKTQPPPDFRKPKNQDGDSDSNEEPAYAGDPFTVRRLPREMFEDVVHCLLYTSPSPRDFSCNLVCRLLL